MNHRILTLTAAAVTATAALLATPALALAAPTVASQSVDSSGFYRPYAYLPGHYVCDGTIVSHPPTIVGPIKAPTFNLDPNTGDIDPDNPRYGSIAGGTLVSYLPHTSVVYLEGDHDSVQLTDGRWVHWHDLTNAHNCGNE